MSYQTLHKEIMGNVLLIFQICRFDTSKSAKPIFPVGTTLQTIPTTIPAGKDIPTYNPYPTKRV